MRGTQRRGGVKGRRRGEGGTQRGEGRRQRGGRGTAGACGVRRGGEEVCIWGRGRKSELLFMLRGWADFFFFHIDMVSNFITVR